MKMSVKEAEKRIKEELRDAKMYRKYGFYQIAIDEERHAKILKEYVNHLKEMK